MLNKEQVLQWLYVVGRSVSKDCDVYLKLTGTHVFVTVSYEGIYVLSTTRRVSLDAKDRQKVTQQGMKYFSSLTVAVDYVS